MSRRVLARALVALLLLGAFAAFAPTAPALAATSKKVEVVGTNWFWESQDRTRPSEILAGLGVDVGQICALAPICPDPVVGLPNPHEPGGLPVMVLSGVVEKVSAIQFDLEFLPFQGAEIHSFKFSVVESMDPRDISQSFNATDRTILACFIGDIWPPSEDAADEMQDAPPYNCDNGVEGVRKPGELPTDPVRWEFDVTNLVQPWGEDPFTANGFMLVPLAENGGLLETWQLVLKGPRRDVADTPIDEEEPNANNILAEISYTPNPEPPDDDGGSDDGGSDFGGSDGETDGGSTDPDPEPTEEPSPSPTDGSGSETPNEEPASNTTPGSAWYVWLLLPAGLVGLGMVRAAVIEPGGGTRPGGVVTMIREQNAVRRGWTASPEDPPGPFARLTAPLTALASAVRADLANARSKITRKKTS